MMIRQRKGMVTRNEIHKNEQVLQFFLPQEILLIMQGVLFPTFKQLTNGQTVSGSQ